MDRKITELDSIENLTKKEYLVVASEEADENYKIAIQDFVESTASIEVDDHLSLISKNPVENRVITKYLYDLENGGNGDNSGDGDGGSGSGSLNFDLAVASVETETLNAGQPATVEIIDYGKDTYNVKSLGFKFGIPKGADGKDGSGSGSGSGDGGESFGYRTVFAFKSSETKPAKPVGGYWDIVSNKVTYPEGWSSSDNLEKPVWMSNATFDYQGIVEDWTDPFCISGEDGDPGNDGVDSKSKEFIYRQTVKEEQPPVPENNKFIDDYVPRSEGWEDHPQGVSETILCEWVCTRDWNNSSSQWSDWDGPVLWSKYGENGKDGDGVEYIYQLSSSLDAKPATPGTAPAAHSPVQNFQEREFIPAKASTDENEWTDNPSDVSIDYPYEWVSIRKFKWSEQKWGEFQEPTVWAKYGKDGEEGMSSFKSFVFCRTNFTPIAPEADEFGGSFINPVPQGKVITTTGQVLSIYWTDGIPEGTEQIWMTSRIFSSDGKLPQQDYWTTPQAMSDTADFEVMYSPNLNKVPLPDGFRKNGVELDKTWEQNANAAGWYDDANEWGDTPTVWMATNQAKNGVWAGWQILKVQGEKGDAGTSLAINGSFDSYEDLIKAWQAGQLAGTNGEDPDIGDSYLVNGEIYIWDGDSWAYGGYVKGDPGKGVVETTSWYAISQYNEINDQCPITGSWVVNSPATDRINKYLWKKTTIKYGYVGDDATDDVTYFELIGTHGDRGIDGDSIEYIYKLTQDEGVPEVPSRPDPINSNGEPGEWTDDPLDVDDTWRYQWISSHTKTYDEDSDSMIWTSYSTPSIWTRYVEDGDNAFKSTVFTRSNETPRTPQGGSYINPIPEDTPEWTDGVTAGSQQLLWASTRIFTKSGKEPQQSEWTTPTIMADTASFDVEYSSVENPSLPTGHPNTNSQWSNTASEDTLWMATSNLVNGKWTDWSMSKIKGEKGDTGKGIDSVVEYYLAYPHNTGVTINTSGWDTVMPTLDSTNKYLWNYEKINYSSGNPMATTPVVIGNYAEDGKEGKGIKSIQEKYARSSSSTVNPSVWEDTVPELTPTLRCLWNYEIITYTDGSTTETEPAVIGVYGDTGAQGPAGNSIKSIIAEYNIANVDTGVGDSSSYPSVLGYNSWHSSSPSVNENYKYIWKRSKIEFTDGDTSDAWSYEMIGSLGEPGVDGDGRDGNTTEYAFLLTTGNSIPSAPSGSVEGQNTPGRWTDDPQYLGEIYGVKYKYQWVSQRTGIKSKNEWDAWSTPTIWAQLYPGLYLHIKYSNDMVNFTSNNGEDVGKYIGVLSDYNQGDSGEFDDYTWSKFQGDDGFGREYIFTLSSIDNVSVPTSNQQYEQYVPSGWSADPLSPTSTQKYCMACHRDYRNNVWGSWKGNSTNETKAYIFSMFAESVPGETGASGPTLYPAGYFDQTKTYHQTLTNGNPTATPYVLYKKDGEDDYTIYILNTATSTPGYLKDSEWIEAEMYDALYTDILLANNAKVGAAVFNNNYMFSQNGEGDISTFDGTVSNPYAVSNGFKPAWCVNLVTGEMWTGKGTSHFAADGSGYLADGDLYWTSDGRLFIPQSGMLKVSYQNTVKYLSNQLNYDIEVRGTYGDNSDTRLILTNTSENLTGVTSELNWDDQQIPFYSSGEITVYGTPNYATLLSNNRVLSQVELPKPGLITVRIRTPYNDDTNTELIGVSVIKVNPAYPYWVVQGGSGSGNYYTREACTIDSTFFNLEIKRPDSTIQKVNIELSCSDPTYGLYGFIDDSGSYINENNVEVTFPTGSNTVTLPYRILVEESDAPVTVYIDITDL